MKELSIEEKAIAYDKAIERAKKAVKDGMISENFIADIFLEFKDEDERIRKDIATYLKSTLSNKKYGDKIIESWIAWLEKQSQGEQKPANWIQELEYKLSKATPEQLAEWKEKYFKIEPAWSEKGDEQKPVSNIQPKFKQGDIVREKETGILFYVNSVEDFGYTLHYKNCTEKGCTVEFKYEDNYEVTPFWGEDDKEMIRRCISATFDHGYLKECNWLKSLKERIQYYVYTKSNYNL